MIRTFQSWVEALPLPAILVTGIMILLAFYAGRGIRRLRLPALIGFLFIGILMGPSVLNVIDNDLRMDLDFITQIALGVVALGIGLELSLRSVWRKGPGILILTLSQLAATMIVVSAGIFFLTRNMALALILGAIATTTEPAGTMAVIQESGSRGSMAKTLYAVIGYDNGLGIVVFGFAIAIGRAAIANDGGVTIAATFLPAVLAPLAEMVFSLMVGGGMGFMFCILLRSSREKRGVLILTFAVIFITIGLCRLLDISFIFALMITGAVVVNTQPAGLLERLRGELTEFMPLLYVLFFALAGANLHLDALPHIGGVGLVYVLCRSIGKIGGSWYGAHRGGLEEGLCKYTGMALLSQAGMAIGLALIVQNEFARYGTQGETLGVTVLTTVSAACIVFELIGPLLAEKALKKSDETG